MKDADRNSEALDAVLRRAMREPPGDATPECADAESIAAYFDGSIAAAERQRLDVHFADCARCQAQLAAIARADESARAASVASKAPWYRRWQFAVPAFAAAAAVAVFVAIRLAPVEQSKNAEVVAMAKREVPVANRVMPEEAPAPAARIASPALSPSAPKQLAMNEPRTQAASRPEANSVQRLHRMKIEVRAPASPAPVERRGDAGQVVAIAPAAPFVAPGSTTQAPAAAQPAPSTSSAQSEAFSTSVTGTGAAQKARAGAAPAGAGAAVDGGAIGAASGTIAGAAIGARPATEQMSVAAPAAANYPESSPTQAQVSSADHAVTWIVGRNGTVQRRDANGAIRTQHSGVTTDLVAGSAASPNVCWIVGRSGTIIRTTDGGEHWTLITPPAAENLAAVSASSASDATITTASGRRFATSDGGMSWRPQ